MTLVVRLLTLAVIAGFGLPFAGAFAAFNHTKAPATAAPAIAAHSLAIRNTVVRPDGISMADWARVAAAFDAELNAQFRAGFSAKLDAAIIEMTPPPPPPPPPAPIFIPKVTAASLAPPAAPSYSGSVPDLIRAVFAAAGAGGVDWALRVAKCESGFNPNSYNASSGASGVFQFLPSTWRASPYASSSPFDAQANVRAALWLYQRSGPNQWVCT